MISYGRYCESKQRYYYWVCNKPTKIKSFKKQRNLPFQGRRDKEKHSEKHSERKESTNKQQLQKINGGTFASLKKQIANQKENSRVCKSC
jgi:hypothetical protein